MLFTSFDFIAFLAAVFIAYYAIPPKFQRKLQWLTLLAASGFFYYLTGAVNLLYIAATIVTAYIAGLAIDRLHKSQEKWIAAKKADSELPKDELKAAVKRYKERNKHKRLALLFLCLLINFGLLSHIRIGLLAVVGASYYIFRCMSYLIDVYRAKHPCERNPLKFALFASFFPLIIQGPIARYDEIAPALFGGNRFEFKSFSFGVQRILWGFFKKLVIADRLAVACGELFSDPGEYRGVYALIAMLFYAITLYCDFTAGIDIAIGAGQALRIPIAENFNSPFLSRNIFEYWRRWHITMGAWFRDYLFYPLSVWKPMLKLGNFTRKHFGNAGKRIPVHITTLVTWFATGIWHGFSWNFVVWGLANGVVIVISQELSPLFEKFNTKVAITKTFAYSCFEVVRTFLLLCFIRAFDCYATVAQTVSIQLSVFTDFVPSCRKLAADLAAINSPVGWLKLGTADYIVVVAGLLVLFIASYIKNKKQTSCREWLSAKPMALRFAVFAVLVFGTLIFGQYGFGYDSAGFIYGDRFN